MIQIDDTTIKRSGSKFDILADYFMLTEYMADIFNISVEEFAFTVYHSIADDKPELTEIKTKNLS